MKFLFASDSFKGSLSSQKTAELLAKAAREIFPDCQCDSIVVADGGEGTTAAVLAATNGKKLPVQVHGPLWEDITSNYGMLDENRAVMEMAAASGLPLVPEEKRDPRYTTSYGTGEMIADALRRGFRDISIAIGGSATNDGGIGCIRALGGKFLDENNQELKGCGEDLMKIRKIDLSGLNPLIKECKFTVMSQIRFAEKTELLIHLADRKVQPPRFKMIWKLVCVITGTLLKSNLIWIWIIYRGPEQLVVSGPLLWYF